MAGGSGPAGVYDATLTRRQALMGASGPAALVKNMRVFALACFACIGGLLYGYNQGVFSGILTMNNFMGRMGDYDSNRPEDQSRKGWLTSILELGAWLGALLSGFLAETLSRKYTILFATCVFMIGVVIQTTAIAAGHASILGGRFITGLAVGSLSTVVPMYNAEVAPPEVRGSLVGVQQLAICGGIMISFWINYGTNYIGGTGASQGAAAWLLPICLQLIPAVVLLIGIFFMPFTPRWLVHHGREDEAYRTLVTLRGLPEGHELVELEFLEIRAQSMFEKRTVSEKYPHLVELTAWNTFKLQFVAIASLFTTKGMRKRVIVATVEMFFSQWNGINAILYYAPTIFGSMGLSSNTTSLLATGVVGILMFLFTIPAVLYIDKMGRRPTMAIGSIAMATCHIIIAIIVSQFNGRWEMHRAAGWAAVAMVWLFICNFSYSWGPCCWILVSEIWPISARPYGIALGTSSEWMNNFIVGQVTPDMLSGIGYGTYIIFGVLTYLSAAFIWFYVPETSRLTLEEMDVVFGSEGTAHADLERMNSIRHEIGLDIYIGESGVPAEKVEEKSDATEHCDKIDG
ncbi:hypothetical protein B7463_g6059, partial [Scytalidium lignicola]